MLFLQQCLRFSLPHICGQQISFHYIQRLFRAPKATFAVTIGSSIYIAKSVANPCRRSKQTDKFEQVHLKQKKIKR